MVAVYRPIERMMDNRYERMLSRVERQLIVEGRHDDAKLIRAVLNDDEGMAMLKQESTVAFARAEGVEVAAFGEQGRPFLDFLGRMIDGQVFRKFAEWVFEHKEQILELAKMIAAIIGIFA